MSGFPTSPDLLRLLARLTRKGARLVQVDGTVRIAVPGQRRRRTPDSPDDVVSPALVAAATEHGWIAAVVASHDSQPFYRLTEAGALVLRRGAATEVPRAVEPAPITIPVSPRAGGLTPLQRLRQKRDGRGVSVVSSVQVEAGERLARDFHAGQMMPRTTANWDRAKLGFAAERRPGAGANDVRDGAAAAQERVRRALDDAGPEFAGLLIDVCCLEIGMEAIELQRQWPPRTARVVLGLALDRLVRHYGMIAAGPARGQTAHWGDASYKPPLSRWQGDSGAERPTR